MKPFVNTILYYSVFLGLFSLSSCREPLIRKPLEISGGKFINKAVEKKKQCSLSEQKIIENYMKNDSLHQYYLSKHGFWYKYLKANATDTLKPKSGDIAELEFYIEDFNKNLLLSKEKSSPNIYLVDKQEIILGLKHGIKLMRKNETIAFIFPSNLTKGHPEDSLKLPKKPIICTTTLINFKTQQL